MLIGTFRRQVMKTVANRATKTALRTVAKNTVRTQAAQASVALRGHVGLLVQGMAQAILGLQQTQEMKDNAFKVMGDIGYDLTLLCRVLKVKMPSSTKKVKLVGTRGAALLHLDSLSNALLRQVEQGAFVGPKMTTVQKMVPMPQKGGVKEERTVEVVDSDADTKAEADRQTEMKSFLTGAVDVYWRLCFDMFGQPPVAVLDEKFKRMKKEFPGVAWAEASVKPAAKVVAPPAPVAKAGPKAIKAVTPKKAAPKKEAVPA